MEIREVINDSLKSALKTIYNLEVENVHLEHPAELEHGDYASNLPMVTAKKVGKPSFEIAEALANQLKKQGLPAGTKEVEVAKPGFINFFLSQTFLIGEVERVIKDGNRYGCSTIGKGKTVIIDYSSSNIARPFSIGHLRSTIIGQALYNIYTALGYRTIGDNHLGDWGTQFGKLIYAIKEWSDPVKLPSMRVQDLVNLYVRFHKEIDKNPSLSKEGRLWFKRLEEGHKEAREIWQQCVKISLEEFNRIYDLLDVQIDFAFGESFYKDKMPAVIEEARKLGIAGESEGALAIRLDNEMPPVLLLKSDGASTYHTRDLATIKFRQERFGPVDEMIYETGVDHELHFRQLFAAAQKFNWGKNVKYKHVGHGMVRLPTGRMQTRKGKVVLLEDILNEAIKRAGRIVEEESPDLSNAEREEIARAVGIGAVKYNDLCQHYSTDIIFDWEKMLNLQGNSGPYLQYTYARAKSVLRKIDGDEEGIEEITKKKKMSLKDLHLKSEEQTILRTLYQFPEVIQEAGKMYAPHLVCQFLYCLATKYNTLYQKLPILKADSEELRQLRLLITAGVSQILSRGLYLLGIKVPERM